MIKGLLLLNYYNMGTSEFIPLLIAAVKDLILGVDWVLAVKNHMEKESGTSIKLNV